MKKNLFLFVIIGIFSAFVFYTECEATIIISHNSNPEEFYQRFIAPLENIVLEYNGSIRFRNKDEFESKKKYRKWRKEQKERLEKTFVEKVNDFYTNILKEKYKLILEITKIGDYNLKQGCFSVQSRPIMIPTTARNKYARYKGIKGNERPGPYFSLSTDVLRRKGSNKIFCFRCIKVPIEKAKVIRAEYNRSKDTIKLMVPINFERHNKHYGARIAYDESSITFLVGQKDYQNELKASK